MSDRQEENPVDSSLEQTAQSDDKPKKDTNESDGETKIKADENSPEKAGKVEGEDEEMEGQKTPVERSESRESEMENKAERPVSSESSGRPKSSGSDIMYQARGRRKKKLKIDPDARQVTFTVTISIAIPTIEDEEVPDIKQLMKKKKQVFEAPRAQNYYHVEYYLTPEESSLQKVDVVTYGPAAIIFMASHDPKVLRTWQEGELTWVAWSHKHTINITKDLLLKMFMHRIELRIWDTKDKVGAKARFTKPKQFKLPSTKPGEEDQNGAKAIVARQSRSFSKMQPKKSSEIRPIPTQMSMHTLEKLAKRREEEKPARVMTATTTLDQAKGSDARKKGTTPPSPTPKTLVAVPSKSFTEENGRTSYSRLGRLAQSDPAAPHSGSQSQRSGSDVAKSHSKARLDQSKTTLSSRGVKSADSTSSVKREVAPSPPRPRRSKKQEAAAQQAVEHIRKYGVCMIPIRLASFFSGLKTMTSRLDLPVAGVEDVFFSLKLDTELMSEEQKLQLNPMIVTVQSVSNLPSTPMSFDELDLKCQPVYCKYKFLKQQEHSSIGREHNRNVYWDDINVVLLGNLETSELHQYLNGPPLEIEIHDRDRKPEDVKLKPTLFGDDLEDEKISNVGTVASRRTVNNPFKGRNKPWDPYGVAKIDLSELLHGHSYLQVKVPVHNCPIPEVFPSSNKNSGDSRAVGVFGAVDGPVDKPLNAGHYVHSNTMLKVRVQLAHPLTTPEKVAAKQPLATTPQCPFGRIVFKFHYRNTTLLHQLQNMVTDINAQALELDDMPQHVINAALSTYKLSLEQQRSRSLNIVTGFQVMDGEMHVFVLEGLRDRAVRALWESLPAPENSDVTVLYNSDLSFSDRLYGPLDVDLCRVKLHEPLSQIVQQPLLYVRDMVPKPCFDALLCLHQMTQVYKMKDIVRNSLFPTADMVISMSKEFGVPLTQEDFEELQPDSNRIEKEAEVQISDRKEMAAIRETSRIWTPIDNFNEEFMEKINARDHQPNTDHDFIQENINVVKTVSELNKVERAKNKIPTIHADVKVAHNYSTQSLNSTELAKEKLRQVLAEEPDTRFTYCQDYHHSMTVVPVNVEALKKQEAAESKAQWKTANGWIYPGMKTTLECNVHSMRPDTARVEELTEEWRENILHVGMLQPPLERDRLPWEHRYYDFELYRRPQSCFIREPITIHMAGQKLKEEKLEALKKDIEVWKSKVVVDDSRSYFQRCLKETELQERGLRSQNQIDKLQGLLKDKPSKFSLRKPGMVLKDIPPLNVVLNPSVDTDARRAGLPTIPAVENEGVEKIHGFKPGPFEGHSWNLERNKIPVHDYQHKMFSSSKGSDFNAIHTERTKLHKRQIFALKDWERDNHLFRIPDDPKRFGPYESLERSATLPPVESPTSKMMLSNVMNQAMQSGYSLTNKTGSPRNEVMSSVTMVNPTESQVKMEGMVN